VVTGEAINEKSEWKVCITDLREPAHPEAEDRSPNELYRYWNSVGRMVVPVVRGIVHNSGEEETNGNSPLIGTDDGTTNPFRRAISIASILCSTKPREIKHGPF
jgi:hypothetical protein